MSSISIVAAIFLLAAVFAFWLIMSYKGFVRLRNSAEEAFSTTEVYMKRRRELLSRFVKLAEKAPGEMIGEISCGMFPMLYSLRKQLKARTNEFFVKAQWQRPLRLFFSRWIWMRKEKG